MNRYTMPTRRDALEARVSRRLHRTSRATWETIGVTALLAFPWLLGAWLDRV